MFMRILFRGACTFLCSCCVMLSTNNGWAKVSQPNSDVISGSYQVAKVTFLPDLVDSEFGFSGNELDDDKNQDNCKGYQLDSCPEKAFCQRCPFDATKFKILGCATGYYLLNNACSAGSCTGIDSSYSDTIPNNNICTKFTESGKTCYKDCRAVSCKGYTASCSNKPEHAVSVEKCPDCKDSSNSKCGDNVCKVTECEEKYKVNADGTGCVLKDDTCPENYYKSCESGTQGEPKYTEMGTACYQCKSSSGTCLQYLTANYPDKTIITTQQELQHALIDNKDNFVVANDITLTSDIDLSDKTIVGASEIASSYPACAGKPSITAKTSIKTNDNTVMKSLRVYTDVEGKYNQEKSIIVGGGSYYNMVFASDKSYTHLLNITGTAKLYNTTFDLAYSIRINDESKLTFYGETVVDKVSNYFGGSLVKVVGSPTITLDTDGSIQTKGAYGLFIGSALHTSKDIPIYNLDGKIVCENSDKTYDLFVNTNGTITFKKPVTCPKGKITITNGTLNINAEATLGRLYGSSTQMEDPSQHATININAATTIDADNFDAVSMSFHWSQPDTLNVNAPLTIVNAPKDNLTSSSLTSLLEVNTMYINSDVDGGGGFLLDYIVPQQITFGPKAKIKNLSRIMWKKQYSDMKLIYNAGAELTLGGVCKKVTANTVDDRQLSSPDVEWKTPQSPFTAACSGGSEPELPNLSCGINSSWMTCGGNKCCCPNDRGCDTGSLQKWCMCESTGSEPTTCEAGTKWNGTCCETLCGLATCPCAH